MLGANVLKQLLRDGHSVNAVIRSFAKSKAKLVQQYASETQSGQLTFTEIPDMTVAGVFDEPANGPDAIIHVATPLERQNFLETIIKPTSIVNFNVFSAASKSPTVKRVIVTGSIVTTLKLPEEILSGKTFSEKTYNSLTSEEALESLPRAYQYSKTKSEKEAWTYMSENKPKFDLIFLLAPSIIGKNIQDGFVATKYYLGGVSGFYKDIFDLDVAGFLFPYYMYVVIIDGFDLG
jgi:NADPH-dependent methylglyoxal reductase